MNRYKKLDGAIAKLIVVALTINFVFTACTISYSLLENTYIPCTGTIKECIVQRVYGDKILDENGNEVVWRGAGGSYLFHAGDNYQKAWESHISQIEAMHLNTIRLAFAFPDSSVNPNTGVPDSDILDYATLDWVLAFLAQHGIKAILDCHNYADMHGDFGSQKLTNDWVNLAKRYRGDSRIVAYELFNEPGSTAWAPSVTSTMDVIKAYANLTDAVRAVDPEHIVIWMSRGILAYAEDLDKFKEVLQPYLKPNLVFTVHYWRHKEFSFNIWNPKQVSYIVIDYLVKARSKLNVPFWLGEFGSGSPFNFSNPEYQWFEQTLWRCEEQVLGWNMWMGETVIDKPWNQYLQMFPLEVYNTELIRKPWAMPIPNLKDYVVNGSGIDDLYPLYYPLRVGIWHNNDNVTFKPGIIIRVIVNHKLPDGTVEVASEETIGVTEQLTIRNEEGTTEHLGDWNTNIYSTGFAP